MRHVPQCSIAKHCTAMARACVLLRDIVQGVLRGRRRQYPTTRQYLWHGRPTISFLLTGRWWLLIIWRGRHLAADATAVGLSISDGSRSRSLGRFPRRQSALPDFAGAVRSFIRSIPAHLLTIIFDSIHSLLLTALCSAISCCCVRKPPYAVQCSI